MTQLIKGPDQPLLAGRWQVREGVLCCGLLQVASFNFDADSSDEFKQLVYDHMLDSLNAPASQALDAARYRWLRKQNWNDGELAVVVDPKKSVRLGHDCPSLDRLDAAIDDAMKRETQ